MIDEKYEMTQELYESIFQLIKSDKVSDVKLKVGLFTEYHLIAGEYQINFTSTGTINFPKYILRISRTNDLLFVKEIPHSLGEQLDMTLNSVYRKLEYKKMREEFLSKNEAKKAQQENEKKIAENIKEFLANEK